MAGRQLSNKLLVTDIRPPRGWRFVDLRELWNFRDLLYFLVWRDIKARYAQSVLGIGWAIIQPFSYMIVFTLVFGGLAKISSDGVPYAIFNYIALVPWLNFSGGLTAATVSLVENQRMLTRTYVPRVIMPMSAVAGRLPDFGIAFILVLVLMAWFKIVPTFWALLLPWFMALMIITSMSMGLWLSALTVQYRDIAHGMGLLVQLMLFATPVVYPASLIPDQYRLWYGLNPMVGVIEGFRSAFLGTNPMPWDFLAIGSISAILIGLSGLFYFRRMERNFADVV